MTDIAIAIPCERWTDALADVEERCRHVVSHVLTVESLPGVSADRLEISLVLADDAMVQELNRQYRGQDKPTNVLSFAALDDDDPPEDGPVLLGDVILAYETTVAEAAAEAKPLADHLSHLVVHGMLHLLGFDHEEDAEAEEMEGLERTILGGLGIADPYAVGEHDVRI